MTVSDWEQTVTAALDLFGWRHCHTRPIFDGRKKRWVTPTTAVGWPDLIAVHPPSGVVLAAEIKGTTGRKADPTAEQVEWLRIWHHVPVAAAVVLRPGDNFDVVSGWLRRPTLFPSGFGWLPEDEWRCPAVASGHHATSGGRPGPSGRGTRRPDHVTHTGVTPVGHQPGATS